MVEATTRFRGPLMRPAYQPTQSLRVNIATGVAVCCVARLALDNLKYMRGKFTRNKATRSKAKIPFWANVRHVVFGAVAATPRFYKQEEFAVLTGKHSSSSCDTSAFRMDGKSIKIRVDGEINIGFEVNHGVMVHTCPHQKDEYRKDVLFTPVPSSFNDSFDPVSYKAEVRAFLRTLKDKCLDKEHVVFDPRLCVKKQSDGSLKASFRSCQETKDMTAKMLKILHQKYNGRTCLVNTAVLPNLYTQDEINELTEVRDPPSISVSSSCANNIQLNKDTTSFLLDSGTLAHCFPCKSTERSGRSHKSIPTIAAGGVKARIVTPTLLLPLPQMVLNKVKKNQHYEDRVMAWFNSIPESVKASHHIILFDPTLHFSNTGGQLVARLKPFEEQQQTLAQQLKAVLALQEGVDEVKLVLSGSCMAATSSAMAKVLNETENVVSCSVLPFPEVAFGNDILRPNLVASKAMPLIKVLSVVDAFFKRNVPAQTTLFNELVTQLKGDIQQNTLFYAKSSLVKRENQRFKLDTDGNLISQRFGASLAFACSPAGA